ncbi:Dihydrofolate synthase/folylpolyglutamate synthase [Propionicimonas sp. T2.31MG-18]|uniref:bifunctional folylpolyglutamate synthase/dihydrofolate synthase n=1 Tax=Propionicimonas sp. T2.31MG-18 TaxID=3157620 RepID=UPI0035EB1D7F
MSRTHAQIVAELQDRWPEHRVAPSQARVRALCDLLGSPERSLPVILIAGTNGKGSTALMIDSLLRALGLRVGRYASPHLVDVTERISIDGEPISEEAFDALVEEVSPLVELVDAQLLEGVRMTFFEVMTALAYAAFADAPVDVAVVEVGLGGRWDATNIVEAEVAVVCPVDLDHTHLLGGTVAEIAAEKAGIIKAGAKAVLAAQQPEAARVLLARCAEVGAEVLREGVEFGLIGRTPAIGGQVLRLDTAEGPLGDLFLPLFGAHMAQNAALAVAAVEAFLGGKPLPPEVISAGLEQVEAPARLEIVRRSPTVVIDTCHNPHGARATIDAVTEAFDFTPLVGVVAMMADKDVDGVLGIFAEAMTSVVCTSIGSTTRALPAADLGERAAGVFGADRVVVVPGMAEAIEEAVRLADEAGPGSGVLVAGSVYAAGEARALLVRPGADA